MADRAERDSNKVVLDPKPRLFFLPWDFLSRNIECVALKFTK